MSVENQPVLSVRGLTVALPSGADRAHAVENVSLSVGQKEILCVVGESGSGKSVTSYAVMGLLAPEVRPVAGEILFAGQDLLKAPPAAIRKLRGNRIAMIFQEPMTALSPTMRVGRQIEEALRIHTAMTAAQREARVLELMRLLNLPEPELLRLRYPHELSGGQRQRVMIAMALGLEPDLLIADEPTTALDVTTQAQILRQIRDIQQRKGMAVLFVTHDFGVVADIADRVVVMQQGHVVEQGTAQEVLGQPKHAYTRALLAAIPGLHRRRRAPIKPDAPVVLGIQGLTKIYTSGGLTRRRRSTIAVGGADLTVRRGETLAIVGESGSGKSTVARCVSQLIEASAGRIMVDGVELGGRRREENGRLVQIVFQDPNRSLNPRWTIGQSMLEGMRNIAIPRKVAEEKAHSLLLKVGLGEAAFERYPHEFSGGQRQRICIARALSMQPRLLIADEAVSALDVSVQAQVLALLDSIQQEFDLSLLFITHDLRVAVQIGDRIAVMHKGLVVEEGPAAEIYGNPQHPYTRQLFDAAPGRHHAEMWEKIVVD